MMKLVHKSLFSRVEIDSLSGVYSSSWERKRLKWKEIVGIAGFKRAGIFTRVYQIGIASQGNGGHIANGILLETSNEWKYRYFIEAIVTFLKENHGAVGGQSWCIRNLDKNGGIVQTSYDFYQAFVFAKILAGKLKHREFDCSENDCEAAAYDFVQNKLDRSAAVEKQLSEAISKLGLMPFSSAYMILDTEISKHNARHNNSFNPTPP